MPLTQAQIKQLDDAITGYNFPTVYFDFQTQNEITTTIAELEVVLASQLRSNEVNIAKCGLANVLYWGYAKIGYRKNRVDDFISNVSNSQLTDFQTLIKKMEMPTMKAIKEIGLPQYSGVSFISKILMFLNPCDYCILDQQLAKLRTIGSPKILNVLSFGVNDTQIRITYHNETVYGGWRNECKAISKKYFQGNYRAVDIERGFFNLIQRNNLSNAQKIYNDA